MTIRTVALVGLGGNLGDAAATVRHALQDLDAVPHTRLMRGSRVYRTPAWGRIDQPDFINAVAMVETALPPRELLDAMLEIEHKAGRTPSGRSLGSAHVGPGFAAVAATM